MSVDRIANIHLGNTESPDPEGRAITQRRTLALLVRWFDNPADAYSVITNYSANATPEQRTQLHTRIREVLAQGRPSKSYRADFLVPALEAGTHRGSDDAVDNPTPFAINYAAVLTATPTPTVRGRNVPDMDDHEYKQRIFQPPMRVIG